MCWEIVLKSGDLTRLFSDSMETRGTIYVTGVSRGGSLKKYELLPSQFVTDYLRFKCRNRQSWKSIEWSQLSSEVIGSFKTWYPNIYVLTITQTCSKTVILHTLEVPCVVQVFLPPSLIKCYQSLSPHKHRQSLMNIVVLSFSILWITDDLIRTAPILQGFTKYFRNKL